MVVEDGVKFSEKSAPNPSRSESSMDEFLLSLFSVLLADDDCSDGDEEGADIILSPPSDMTSLALKVLQSSSKSPSSSPPSFAGVAKRKIDNGSEDDDGGGHV